MFSPSTDSTVRKRVIDDFINVDSVLAVEILEQNDQYPVEKKLTSLGKTIYLINSNYHTTDSLGFKKYHVPYYLLYVGPTGHYPMIENPAAFNTQLQKLITQIGKLESKQPM